MARTRVFINNRDLLTWPREMARILLTQGHEVIIVDNASTYEPLLLWYDEIIRAGVRVIHLTENLGHLAPWKVMEPQEAPYVVTDPDLDISAVPADWPEVLAEGLNYGSKCGLSLDETKVPAANPAWMLDGFVDYPAGDHPLRWGERLRFESAGQTYYRYPVDTTFALYRPDAIPGVTGLRVGRPYTARHIPWHIVLEHDTTWTRTAQVLLNDEMYYYYTHANSSSTTAGRMRDMLAEYHEKRQG